MNTVMYLVTGLGFAASLVVLVLALRAGKLAPEHRGLWIAAMVILGIGVGLHIPLIVGGVVGAGVAGAWIVVGSVAIAVGFAAAFFRPLWAGWVFIGTAIVLPALTWLADLLMTTGPQDSPPWPQMLAFYSMPALVTGLLLILSMRTRPDEETQPVRSVERAAR